MLAGPWRPKWFAEAPQAATAPLRLANVLAKRLARPLMAAPFELGAK